jgi:hypothetical protein
MILFVGLIRFNVKRESNSLSFFVSKGVLSLGSIEEKYIYDRILETFEEF